jgi:hypothetical protein
LNFLYYYLRWWRKIAKIRLIAPAVRKEFVARIENALLAKTIQTAEEQWEERTSAYTFAKKGNVKVFWEMTTSLDMETTPKMQSLELQTTLQLEIVNLKIRSSRMIHQVCGR